MKNDLPVFDNHDHRIKYYELLLKRDDLDNIPEHKLPEGYRFVFYKSGNRDGWKIIKTLTNHSALAEFDCAETAEIYR